MSEIAMPTAMLHAMGMIVRTRPSLSDVLVATRGSILPFIVRPLIFIVAVSVGAV